MRIPAQALVAGCGRHHPGHHRPACVRRCSCSGQVPGDPLLRRLWATRMTTPGCHSLLAAPATPPSLLRPSSRSLCSDPSSCMNAPLQSRQGHSCSTRTSFQGGARVSHRPPTSIPQEADLPRRPPQGTRALVPASTEHPSPTSLTSGQGR